MGSNNPYQTPVAQFEVIQSSFPQRSMICAILFSLMPIGVSIYFEGWNGLRILLPIAIYSVVFVVAAVALAFLVNLVFRKSFFQRYCQFQNYANFALCLLFFAWSVAGLVFKLNPPQ
jgi:hypothetical protein